MVDGFSWRGRGMKASVATIESERRCGEECPICEAGVCAVLNVAELREVHHLGRRVHFARRETVFREQEVATSFFNLRKGIMRLHKLLPDGRRQILGFALPGDFLETHAFGRHKFSADAVGPVTVCKFDAALFGQFSGDKPHLLKRMNELAARELKRARDHMVLLGRRSAEGKVAAFLLDWRERLGPLGGSSDAVLLPMNRQDIADYFGLTIETVSRVFTRLERDGIIEIVHGGVRLLDPVRAKALTGKERQHRVRHTGYFR